MSAAGKTMVAFGIYMAAVGAVLVAAPNFLLDLFGLPHTEEVWLHVLGFFMLIIAYYYYEAARGEAGVFFRATVLGRAAMGIYLAFLVLSGAAAHVLLLFSAAEFAGAAATGVALRYGGTAAPSPRAPGPSGRGLTSDREAERGGT